MLNTAQTPGKPGYEASHWPNPICGPARRLCRVVPSASDYDLERVASRAMILRGERQLTLAHVRTLAERFKVSSDLFIKRAA